MPLLESLGLARAAVEAITRELASAYGPSGIAVIAVALGRFDTESLRKYPAKPWRSAAATVPVERLGSIEECGWLGALLANSLGPALSGSVVTLDGALDNWTGPWPPTVSTGTATCRPKSGRRCPRPDRKSGERLRPSRIIGVQGRSRAYEGRLIELRQILAFPRISTMRRPVLVVSLLVALLVAGCGSSSSPQASTAPTQRSTTTVGHGTNTASAPGAHHGSAPDPMTLISRGAPARSEGRVVYPVTNVNAPDYGTGYRCTPTCAADLDISGVPASERQTVVVSWYNDSNTFQDVAEHVNAYNEPRDFTIDINGAAGGGRAPKSGWTTLKAIAGNVYDAGQYVLNLHGANWIRMRVTAVNGSPGNTDAAWHMDVASANAGTNDTWLFLGDSITNNSMTHREPTNWIQAINASKPSFWPSQVNGGMSTWLTSTFLSTDAKTGQQYIAEFLTAFPDAHYVTINLGSNDVGGGVPAASVLANMETLVQDVLKAGRVPIVPTIPWSPTVCNANLANDNPATPGTANYEIVHKLYAAYPKVVHGPDLWTYFHDNPSLISTSGVPGCPHPTSPTGENDYRALWARTMLSELYP